jgi:GR25 family glycosyltransferase involved in LPS biosynthesis
MNKEEKEFQSMIRDINLLIDTKSYKTAFNLIQTLLDSYYNDDKYIVELFKLQSKCYSIDDGSWNFYNNIIVNKLHKNKPELKEKSITITTTTCKRFILFEQTINSFLNTCLDLEDYLYEWIIIDDNSSEEDRNKMKCLYPFLKFILKSPQQKGHAKSMNMIFPNEIKTNYIFNLEDDWRFFRPDKYITKCFKVLEDDNRIGQCLLNKEYAEDIQMGGIIGGGYRRYTKDNMRYYIHEYLAGPSLDKLSNYLSSIGLTHSSYWPHFSFRAGLTKKEVFTRIGSFNEQAQHFEREYAYRYIENRYITAFLSNICCTHTGRKTWERDDDTKLNAYDLNTEKQFGLEPKKVNNEIKLDQISSEINHLNIESKSPYLSDPLNSINNEFFQESKNMKNIVLPIKIEVINLKRRTDRLEMFYTKNSKELPMFNVFYGVDGMKLKPSHKIQKIFEYNDYNYRRGLVGCALSHILGWNDLLKDPNLIGKLFIEDDAELTDNFMAKFIHTIAISPDADIIFLGHHPYAAYEKASNLRRNITPTTERWSFERCKRESMGGTTAYYITQRGARNMFNWINSNSCRYGIDWNMFYTADINNIYYCSPYLVFADYAQSGRPVDTDIQHIYDGVGYTFEEWLSIEINYWVQRTNSKGINGKIDEIPNINQDDKSTILIKSDIPSKKELKDNINIIKDLKSLDFIKLIPVLYYNVRNYTILIPESMLSIDDLSDRIFTGRLNEFKLEDESITFSRN